MYSNPSRYTYIFMYVYLDVMMISLGESIPNYRPIILPLGCARFFVDDKSPISKDENPICILKKALFNLIYFMFCMYFSLCFQEILFKIFLVFLLFDG